MLAELAIANAAFSVIKEAVANSGDIMAAGESLFKYFDSKAEIQKKANSKGGSDRGDLEEFMALEKLKKHLGDPVRRWFARRKELKKVL